MPDCQEGGSPIRRATLVRTRGSAPSCRPQPKDGEYRSAARLGVDQGTHESVPNGLVIVTDRLRGEAVEHDPKEKPQNPKILK